MDYSEIKNITGLSQKEAQARLEVEGFNELPSSRRRSIWRIAYEIFSEPMFLLLVACGAIYLLLGDVQEAMMLLGFVFVVMGITLYQERKTERALEALRDISSPRALVIRDGQQVRIAGREVVREDILVLAEGDRVPADAVILWSSALSVDESLLTGESIPVRKITGKGDGDMSRPGGEDTPFVYSATLVVRGQGIARVKATGLNTEIGKIGKSLQSLEEEETVLQKETGKLVKNIAISGVVLSLIVIVAYGLTTGSFLHGFLAGITLAMAMLPEEFPVVLTIFLALGAWRISQKNVLTRRVPAVETLGAATVLCVDKTGTLTMNRMTVGKVCAQGEYFAEDPEYKWLLPEKFHEIVEFAILASQHDPFEPMEKALRELGTKTLANTEHLHHNWTLVQEYPLSQELLAMSHVWKSPDGKDYIIAAKGSPEAIIDLCHMNRKEAANINAQITKLAHEGLRIIGVAKAQFKEELLPGQQHDFTFIFVGLVGLQDPVRPTVAESIKECYSAGIRVVMITGDYPGTAMNIARQIGLQSAEKYITGPDLEKMGEAELRERIKETNIFARVMPEQKLLLVKALKDNGEIVAMTGDGVNDAPALKAAHIGIAMGGRGTDVAREAASLVLLDDDFSSIVAAVRLGRRIFDNLKKAMAYILAIHVPIAGLSLIPVLLKWPLVLLPVHIVFLELIIDPACSIVFEAEKEEENIMNVPPRDPHQSLFSRRTIGFSLLQGIIVFVVVLAVYAIALYRGLGELEARALTFTTLIVANIALILTNRSWTKPILATLRAPNMASWLVLAGASLFLGLSLNVPFLKRLFHFSQLHFIDLVICAAAGILSILWFEILKMVNYKKKIIV
jgi:P-type Ca2+ transporter type 2C